MPQPSQGAGAVPGQSRTGWGGGAHVVGRQREAELTAVEAALWGSIAGLPHLPVPLMVKWQEFESESLHSPPAPAASPPSQPSFWKGVSAHLPPTPPPPAAV